jgi:hypothetical protein
MENPPSAVRKFRVVCASFKAPGRGLLIGGADFQIAVAAAQLVDEFLFGAGFPEGDVE